MIDVFTSFLINVTSVQYVPEMLVTIAVLGVVNIVKRIALLEF